METSDFGQLNESYNLRIGKKYYPKVSLMFLDLEFKKFAYFIIIVITIFNWNG